METPDLDAAIDLLERQLKALKRARSVMSALTLEKTKIAPQNEQEDEEPRVTAPTKSWKEVVMGALGEGRELTIPQVLKALEANGHPGMKRDTVAKFLLRMKFAGRVRSPSHGLYALGSSADE